MKMKLKQWKMFYTAYIWPMKFKFSLFLLFFVFTSVLVNAQEPSASVVVPLGGNAWVSTPIGSKEVITDSGLLNWQNKKAIISIYINFSKRGAFTLSPVVKVTGKSEIKCTVNGISKIFTVAENDKKLPAAEWAIAKTGYTKIELQGISRTSMLFGYMNEILISGSAVDEQTVYVKNNEDHYFYWGRRGPSVHLNYELPDKTADIAWFYNEVTVPPGNDVIGSYFMANGFSDGYFGMQVNAATERRILFSVWSPFSTDDPSQIPDDKKIILLKKGAGVHAGEFGNEGSGGQSFLRYHWKAGSVYKFLLGAKPAENNYTTYTAYFYAAAEKKWLLIASFNRPATNTYLTRLHSFLENFEPKTGNITRKACYHNQWVRTTAGEWLPIRKATFTADATARKRFRLDYSGGVENEKFYLRNAGFFNDSTLIRTVFSKKNIGKPPVINFSKLQ